MTAQALWSVLGRDLEVLFRGELLIAGVVSILGAVVGAVLAAGWFWGYWEWRWWWHAVKQGCVIGVLGWFAVLFGGQFILDDGHFGPASWRDSNTLVLARLLAGAGAALAAAFWLHMEHAIDGNDWRVTPQPGRHVFTLRQLLLWQAVLGIVLAGWMVHGRGKVLGIHRDLANRAREQQAIALFERYGWSVQVPNFEPGRGELRLTYQRSRPQPEVTDDTLKQVSEFGRVRVLVVHSNQITDEGLAALATVPELAILVVRGRRITDEGVRALARLPNLEELEIRSPLLTDASLAHLARAPQLKELELHETEQVTPEGREKFRAAKPFTKLYFHHLPPRE